MPVHIDKMESTLEIDDAPGSPESSASTWPLAAGAPGRARLKELLRPIVLEIIDEAMRQSQRRHG